ncbi:DUF1572 family protein [Alicyclobacillus sp. SO9]|uniref:DUF1572 family protein n=1 Tax=Alicyclobacillus sp. SO9 TaxID=2665646 RepID=UPI0018E8E0BF|nr:DUF1572 family protein [Alicyclobacillus sp. SO9]QQE77237.1 DUF1572 family protein [Alicyclobacillus sp. SO9]
MPLGDVYLESVLNNFRNMKATAERAMKQLEFHELQFCPTEESNSIAHIVKHMAGNMASRWTDFLTSDGEKSTRDRDAEFEDSYISTDEMMEDWKAGWDRLFGTISKLKSEDLLKIVYIRMEPHSVVQAIERQIYHLSYHTGQIVYVAKQIRNSKWKTLTIPRGKSKEFLAEMDKKFKGK